MPSALPPGAAECLNRGRFDCFGYSQPIWRRQNDWSRGSIIGGECSGRSCAMSALGQGEPFLTSHRPECVLLSLRYETCRFRMVCLCWFGRFGELCILLPLCAAKRTSDTSRICSINSDRDSLPCDRWPHLHSGWTVNHEPFSCRSGLVAFLGGVHVPGVRPLAAVWSKQPNC